MENSRKATATTGASSAVGSPLICPLAFVLVRGPIRVSPMLDLRGALSSAADANSFVVPRRQHVLVAHQFRHLE